MIYDITADDLFRYIGELYVEKCEAEKQLQIVTLRAQALEDEQRLDKENLNLESGDA